MRTRHAASVLLLSLMVAAGAQDARAEEIDCPPNLINKTVDNVFVNGACTIRNSTVEGNIVVSTGGNLLVQGSTIRGSVQSEGALRVRLQSDPNTGRDSQVIGDVQIKNTAAGLTSTIIDAQIGGTILLDSNGGPTNVFGNTVSGDVQVFQNTAVVRLRDNSIDGNLQCKSNTPRPVNGGGNIVQGNAEDQCAGFSQ
ncbi:MAG: hypothetical protein MUD06_02130 [Rhodospirillales bacterium]|jgi:hypothetical protein|nr:hypothetical protein [Rhodospirillales bacterium]